MNNESENQYYIDVLDRDLQIARSELIDRPMAHCDFPIVRNAWKLSAVCLSITMVALVLAAQK